MKLLVPVDDSVESQKAVQKSIELAIKFHYDIKLIRIVSPHDIAGHQRNEKLWHQVDGTIISGKEKSFTNPDLIASIFLNNIEDNFNFQGVHVEKEILHGKVHEKVIETAKKEEFDLVVIGNKRIPLQKRLFKKSVVRKILIKAPCPVFVV